LTTFLDSKPKVINELVCESRVWPGLNPEVSKAVFNLLMAMWCVGGKERKNDERALHLFLYETVSVSLILHFDLASQLALAIRLSQK
jgi:hypothetical protein